ncbi:hypothetical cytosolic protein [Syntrophus aciditrophicus SB]|uniref:Hypothetical cytosolic protein n=1 Tax=Syntrophus aciditrophicus (strain SB) TaxID=56780 RepID=Q2LUN5_SYNAS|nr:hypothetical cytosolic protein [Syntrophus aciditrophicus SB]
MCQGSGLIGDRKTSPGCCEKKRGLCRTRCIKTERKNPDHEIRIFNVCYRQSE